MNPPERWQSAGRAQLHHDVTELVNRYARAFDRADWAAVGAVFHPDAHDDHGSFSGSPAELVAFMRERHRHVEISTHHNTNVLILEVDAERREALVETYCIGVQRLSPHAPEIPPLYRSSSIPDSVRSRVCTVGNRYLDVISERDGELRIAHRTVIYDWITVSASPEPGPFGGWKQGRRTPDDPGRTTLAGLRAARSVKGRTDGRAERAAALAAEGPLEPALGHAFLTLVEPHAGHEAAYTRWYEDDHFHTGAMGFPWWFSGRRWLATRDLRALRDSSDATVDLGRGWSFATYWITRGRLADQARWLEATVARLRDSGRMFAERTHVMTAYFDFRHEWAAPGHQPRAVHALEYPYPGVVLEAIEGAPEDWLDGYVTPRLAAGEAAQCLAFGSVPWPGATTPTWFDLAAHDAARVTLLWFLERAPGQRWTETFGRHRAAVESAGHRLAFLGGFVPALAGTDRHLDRIR